MKKKFNPDKNIEFEKLTDKHKFSRIIIIYIYMPSKEMNQLVISNNINLV